MTARPTDASGHARDIAALALILVLRWRRDEFSTPSKPLGEPAPAPIEGAKSCGQTRASILARGALSGRRLRRLGGRRLAHRRVLSAASRTPHPACSRWQHRQGGVALWPCTRSAGLTLPAWTPDGKHVTLPCARRAATARSLYTVASDGSSLKKLLEFGGTINDLRYGAMVASPCWPRRMPIKKPRHGSGNGYFGRSRRGTARAAHRIVQERAMQWVSPPDLYVYEYDWQPRGKGFVGTASPGDGDDHWWTARLYAFSESGTAPRVVYEPRSPRQQLANPKVSRDGRTLAFIAGLMSDFGSTGGDVFTVPIDGGAAMNFDTGNGRIGDGACVALRRTADRETAHGRQNRVCRSGSGVREDKQEILWGGNGFDRNSFRGNSAGLSAGLMAVEHESFTEPPEIEVGTIGSWRNLTAENAGARLAAQVRSLWVEERRIQGSGVAPAAGTSRRKVAAVTIVHGGPARRGARLWRARPGVRPAVPAAGATLNLEFVALPTTDLRTWAAIAHRHSRQSDCASCLSYPPRFPAVP